MNLEITENLNYLDFFVFTYFYQLEPADAWKFISSQFNSFYGAIILDRTWYRLDFFLYWSKQSIVWVGQINE